MQGHTPNNEEQTRREGMFRSHGLHELQGWRSPKPRGTQTEREAASQRVLFSASVHRSYFKVEAPQVSFLLFSTDSCGCACGAAGAGERPAGSNKQPLWLWISSRPCLEATVRAGGGGLGAGAGLGVLLKSDSSSRILLTVVTILASPLHINTA